MKWNSGTADTIQKVRGGIERNKIIQQSTRQGTNNNTPIREEGGGEGEDKKKQRRGEECHAIPRLLLLGEGDGGAPTCTSPVFEKCEKGSWSGVGGNKICCGGGARE